ncbi:hypothetical protein ACP4OV_010267 [Aristida adscensionis]
MAGIESSVEKERSCESNDSDSSQDGFCEDEERNVSLQEFWKIVQMTFGSEDECYNFYNKYARDKGFSIRKDIVRRERKVGDVFFRRYVCSKEGCRDAELSDIKNRKYRERAKTRCDCPAELSVRFDKARELWFVDNFVDDHNHQLTSSGETPFLRSQRKMKEHLKSEIKQMESMGIRKHVIMDILECKYGGYDKVGIIRKDLYNFCSRYKRSRIVDGDANAALQIMQMRRDQDPDFFYDYEVDAEGRLKNLFWCDAQSRMDYQSFGDVVVFDSTHRINRYKMPFVPFVGLNHHRQTTIFGCGIVGDERVESYIWLLKVFLKAMCQSKPKSIITDSDYAMMKAIRRVLPGTNHRICSWHIERGMPKHLHHSDVNKFRSFIYDACSPAAFEEKWRSFILENQTCNNREWLSRMYSKRKLWAAAFLSDQYFLGMKTNQRSESLNSRLHRHLDYYMSLVDLVEHYEVCISAMRRREAEFDCKASQSWPGTITDSPVLEEAAGHIFTAANFNLVQEELKKTDRFCVDEIGCDGNNVRFTVSPEEQQGKVCFVDCSSTESISELRCSCRKMERDGIPCRHMLSVLKKLELKDLPKCCVLKRLSKKAKGGLPSIRKSDLHIWFEKQARYYELSAIGSELFEQVSSDPVGSEELKDFLIRQLSERKNPSSCDPADIGDNDSSFCRPKDSVLDPKCAATKGAPRANKRPRSFIERRTRLCSRCRQPDHDIRRCPYPMK